MILFKIKRRLPGEFSLPTPESAGELCYQAISSLNKL
jgi:hypothetical protein